MRHKVIETLGLVAETKLVLTSFNEIQAAVALHNKIQCPHTLLKGFKGLLGIAQVFGKEGIVCRVSSGELSRGDAGLP